MFGSTLHLASRAMANQECLSITLARVVHTKMEVPGSIPPRAEFFGDISLHCANGPAQLETRLCVRSTIRRNERRIGALQIQSRVVASPCSGAYPI